MYRFSLVACFTLIAVAKLQAQQPSAPPVSSTATATLTGTVADSTTAGWLSGADIVLSGSELSATTDSLGRFEVAGLKPGTYQLGVFHPRLDTLEVALTTAPFAVVAGRHDTIQLAVPSVRSLMAKRCGRPARENESMLIGKVFSVDTRHPVPQANVSLVWREVRLTNDAEMTSEQRVAQASTDSSGRYAFCGVPSDLHGTVQARRDMSATALIPVVSGSTGNTLSTRNLFLPVANASAESHGRLSGIVTLDVNTGSALEGARVELAGTSMVAETDKRGAFSLSGLPLGTQLLTVRKVGFASQTIPVDILPGEAVKVRVAMTKFVSYLDPVVVTARVNQALKSVGFDERQRQGLGRYVTRTEIEQHQYAYLTDIIRTQVPGINLGSRSAGPVLYSRRRSIVRGAACVRYFVDDVLWQSISENDINAINPSEIAGIEIYRGNAAPIRYSMVDECTTVVIWTKTRVGM